MISHKLHLLCLTEFSNHNHHHNSPIDMTEKPFFLFQKRLSKLGRSCETHHILSKVLRSIAGRIPHLCQDFQFPDITGEATGFLSYPARMFFSWAFSASVKGSINKTAVANDNNGYWSELSKLVYKASSANSIYGSNATVQPFTFQTFIIIKW